MIWLNILANETLLIIAEVLLIVVGSMLMGILLSYFIWGGYKKQAAELQNDIADEKRVSEDLRDQLNELVQIREHLKSEIASYRLKTDTQAKTIYDQNQYVYNKEGELKNQKGVIDGLRATIDSYQKRLKVIEEELSQARNPVLIPHKTNTLVTARANYDHVSQLLGRTVTENDLTLINGIGPKTSALLQSHGITTWKGLADTEVDDLRRMLNDAGGIYKSLDPSSWPKQAIMAAQSEWRKLRIYQETLKKGEPG